MTPVDDSPMIDAELLDRLLRAAEPVAAEALARERGWPPDRVAREIERLRQAGCAVENHPQRGVRLVESSLECWADYLRWRDEGRRRPGRIIQVFRSTASTQDLARRIVEAGGRRADGAVVLADEQSAGRGRLGRRWVAPPASAVLLTRACVAANGQAGPARGISVDRMMFATAVGVARAIEAATAPRPLDVRIKWPNDLLVGEGKIAGVLVETFAMPERDRAGEREPGLVAAIIGVGLNVSVLPEHLPADDPALRRRVTSLAMQGRPVDRLRVADCLVESLDEALDRASTEELLAEWRRRSTIFSQRVRLGSEGRIVQGQVIDIDPYEGLIVRSDDGQIVHLNAAKTTVL
ncbi:MAG: biotin--[acetyl-CoA-carboxylase] ligase [Planctomycetota bacterium]|nr:biotin--[acetyl-CoA-carboxylase] ligase [Planctomycetota bacterium]